MPRVYHNAELRIAQLGTGPLRAPRTDPLPPNPHRPPPGWALLLVGLAVAALVTAVVLWLRRSAYRAWKAYARQIAGEFRARDSFSPRLVSGEVRNRPLLLETAISHEDEAGYFHTRGRVPIKNAGSFILGLRRKSFLELTQTRGQAAPYDLNDAEFERQFFLYCNDNENLPAVLNSEARRELLRYHDVEIYVRMGEAEWRRSGAQSDRLVIDRLNNLLIDMAEAIDRFPSRGRSLTQVMADEKLIEKGL